jgi:hypothetical protein
MAINSSIQDFRPTREKFSTTIPLVSGGFSVREFFPTGEIKVFPWDTQMDEWAVSNKKAITTPMLAIQILKRCAALGKCPPERFCIGDAMAIMMVSKALRSNGAFVHRPKCTACGFEHPEDTFYIPNSLEIIGKKDLDYKGTDDFTLDDCLDVVTVRPLLINDYLRVENRNEVEKLALSDDHALNIWPIVAIGGGKPDSLDEASLWYNALTPADQVQFNQAVSDFSPHLSDEIKYQCDKCSADFVVQIPNEREFFRKRLRKVPPRPLAVNLEPVTKQ